MSVSSDTRRMQLLVFEYYSLLRISGLKQVTEKSPKAAIKYVVSVVRPAQLRTGLEQDLGFSHNDLKANFDGLMAHAPDVSVAFEKVYSDSPKSHKSEKGILKGKQSLGNVGVSSSKGGYKTESPKKAGKSPPAPFALPQCQGKNRRH